MRDERSAICRLELIRAVVDLKVRLDIGAESANYVNAPIATPGELEFVQNANHPDHRSSRSRECRTQSAVSLATEGAKRYFYRAAGGASCLMLRSTCSTTRSRGCEVCTSSASGMSLGSTKA